MNIILTNLFDGIAKTPSLTQINVLVTYSFQFITILCLNSLGFHLNSFPIHFWELVGLPVLEGKP